MIHEICAYISGTINNDQLISLATLYHIIILFDYLCLFIRCLIDNKIIRKHF